MMGKGWMLAIALLLCSQAWTEPLIFKVTVGNVERRALVFPGKDARTRPSPLVFAFHGFSGSSNSMATTKIHRAWPEATVVYPLGLPKYSVRYQYEVPAWQVAPGHDGNRDVLFIDALLADIRQSLKVDDRRIYATGISNGAMLCYVLLVERPRTFAAFACVACAVDFIDRATVPRPMLLIHGDLDNTVPVENARHTREMLKKLNGCGEKRKNWATDYFSFTPCASGQPVIWHLHAGGHSWPGDATTMIVRFFKERALPAPIP